MTANEVRQVREALGLTQAQFAQLLGVHALTVSKWERGVLAPTPHQAGLVASFGTAASRKPDVGQAVGKVLIAAGVVAAIYLLLRAAFGDEETRG